MARKLLVIRFNAVSASFLLILCGLVFADSQNWSEVTRFSGKGSMTTTEPFTCDNVDWRIRWEVEPQTGYLSAYVFPHETQSGWFSSIVKTPENEEMSGILYVHNRSGTFHMDILATQNTTYVLIIEQDLLSIPEIPLWALILFFIILLIIAMIFKKPLKNERFG